MDTLPVIDMAPLFGSDQTSRAAVARAIEAACRDTGFFYCTGHGIAPARLERLDRLSRAFFALPEEQKMQIAMARGGRAWRGYFPLRGELTSGKPDLKEGLYFGEELGPDDARVRAGLAMHGANQFPAQIPELREAVLGYMAATTHAAHALMQGIALALGLDAQYFARTYTREPTLLFRVFRYPPPASGADEWGVGEHTDYGLLTLLAQDHHGGLQVKSKRGWIEAPPIDGALVCNIGDMLDRLTGGAFRSTPHRVRNVSGAERLSFPLFFDPGFAAVVEPLPARMAASDDADERWDRASVHAFTGTYGDYLLGKVGKVFPDLGKKVL